MVKKIGFSLILALVMLSGNLRAECMNRAQIMVTGLSLGTAALSAPGAYFAGRAKSNLDNVQQDDTRKRVTQRCLTGSEGLFWYVTASAGLLALAAVDVRAMIVGGLLMIPASVAALTGFITNAIAFGVQDNTQVQFSGNSTGWGSSDSDLQATFALGVVTWFPAALATVFGIVAGAISIRRDSVEGSSESV